MAEYNANSFVVSVDEAAKLLKMNPHQVREAIDNGSFPFGTRCTTKAGRSVYKISKNKLYEFLGIKEEIA